MATDTDVDDSSSLKRQFGLSNERERQIKRIREMINIVFASNMAKIGGTIILVYLIGAVFAPIIAPHDPLERAISDGGGWVRSASPSLEYPLGTTTQAYPIFSQLVYGARVAFLAGTLTAFIVGVLGTFAGVVAGYYGGFVETLIMRVVDIAYGIPFLPFAIVLILVVGGGGSIYNIVFAISILLWRNTARVIRSEVISIKEQPMIDAAKVSGASDWRIMIRHIFPKVLPVTVLYAIFAVGWAIITEAGLSFLGLGDSDLISWGQMLNEAYVGNAIQLDMWYWLIPPGVAIVLFVASAYFMSQGVEEVVNPQLRDS